MDDEPTVSLACYTFHADKGCFACGHVLAGAPVLLFVHNTDGDLQFQCGASGHGRDDINWLHAHHVLDLHPDLASLPCVDFGFEAERVAVDEPWAIYPIEDEDFEDAD